MLCFLWLRNFFWLEYYKLTLYVKRMINKNCEVDKNCMKRTYLQNRQKIAWYMFLFCLLDLKICDVPIYKYYIVLRTPFYYIAKYVEQCET